MSVERFTTKQLKVKDAMLVTITETNNDSGICVNCFDLLKSPPATTQMPQITVSRSQKNVIRGLHCSPHHKLVQCPVGRAFDVVVDIRPDSPTFLQWDGQWIDRNHHMVIPAFCAHGFFAAEDDTSILYLQGGCFAPELDFSVNYLDKTVNVEWPKPIDADDYIISPKDRNNGFIDDAFIATLRERTRNPLLGRQIAPYSDFAVVANTKDIALPFFEVTTEKNLKAHLCCGNGKLRDTFETEMVALRPKYGVIAVFDVSAGAAAAFTEVMNIAAICHARELPLVVVVTQKEYEGAEALKGLLAKEAPNVLYVAADRAPCKTGAADIVAAALDGKKGLHELVDCKLQ